MKYQEALIAWTPGTDLIRIGRYGGGGINYRCTGGAAFTELRKCNNKIERDMMLFIEFNTIVVRDKIPVEAAHREFLKIDEYRERISPDNPR